MTSKKYMQNAIDSSQQNAENIKMVYQKREWKDPAMEEVMRITDAHNNPINKGGDAGGCSSIPL
jgi:hypothetical protein